jgi:hypothetical protein
MKCIRIQITEKGEYSVIQNQRSIGRFAPSLLSIDSGKSSMKSPSADLIPAAVRILNEETE